MSRELGFLGRGCSRLAKVPWHRQHGGQHVPWASRAGTQNALQWSRGGWGLRSPCCPLSQKRARRWPRQVPEELRARPRLYVCSSKSQQGMWCYLCWKALSLGWRTPSFVEGKSETDLCAAVLSWQSLVSAELILGLCGISATEANTNLWLISQL